MDFWKGSILPLRKHVTDVYFVFHSQGMDWLPDHPPEFETEEYLDNFFDDELLELLAEVDKRDLKQITDKAVGMVENNEPGVEEKGYLIVFVDNEPLVYYEPYSTYEAMLSGDSTDYWLQNVRTQPNPWPHMRKAD
jgi:hypothetical protein